MPPASVAMRCLVVGSLLCRTAARYELGEGTYKDHVLARAALGARGLPAEHWALLKAALEPVEPMADRETLEPLIAANERFFEAVATPHEAESAALQAGSAVPLLVQLVRDWYAAPQPELKRRCRAFVSRSFSSPMTQGEGGCAAPQAVLRPCRRRVAEMGHASRRTRSRTTPADPWLRARSARI